MNNYIETIIEIRWLFESQGASQYYGEKISQFEHAAQTAILAAKEGYDNEVQIAAFLHDIGHLFPVISDEKTMGVFGNKDHEIIAADWLKIYGFSDKITTLIKNHVNAKRYLCFANDLYYEKLSDASKETLAFQGGKMTSEEATAFEQNEYFDAIIMMRIWDEKAKIKDLQLPDLNHFLELCKNHLKQK